MDTPRTSSNGLIVVISLGLLALCGYKLYRGWHTPPTEYAIVVTRQIEANYSELFSDLDVARPLDLVPRIEITRDQVLSKRLNASKEKQAVYDEALRLLKAMMETAQERTQSLETLLKTAAQPRGTLETSPAMTSSSQHFFALQLRRGNESLQKQKPGMDRLFAQVRASEREWNARLPDGTPEETYNFQRPRSNLIRVNTASRQNPLDHEAYDKRRAIVPWVSKPVRE